MQKYPVRNSKQQLFREMVLGTLVYSVVLGFFNDYTDILDTSSYSTTFAVAIVMQTLTHLTLQLKGKIAKFFKGRSGTFSKPALVIGVWLVMFSSKFVFLAVIDFIFNESVHIRGFVGMMIMIVVMTVTKLLIDHTYNKLAD